MRYAQMMRRLHGRRILQGIPTEEELRAAVEQLFVGAPELLHTLEVRWRLDMPIDSNTQCTGKPSVVKFLREHYPGRRDPFLVSWISNAERRIKTALKTDTPLRRLLK